MSIGKAAMRLLLRDSLSAFVERSFRTLNPGMPYQGNWHIDSMSYELERCFASETKRLILCLPPRHLKSICASVTFPAWVLGRDPVRRIVCASYSQDLAAKHARDCRAVLESGWYRQAFPGTGLDRRKNTEQEIVTSARGFRLATSVGGTLTGRGGNLIIVDDPIKPQDAGSAAERERVKQWFDGTLFSRLDNKSADVIIVVMQRVHVDDLVGHLIEKGGWRIVSIPARAEHDQLYRTGPGEDDMHLYRAGEILHPGRESEATLAEVRRNLGTYHFLAQYQQCPVAPGGNLVRADWLKGYGAAPDTAAFDLVVQSWDTASAARACADYSVGTTWGVQGGTYYLLAVAGGRWEYSELKRRIAAEARAHHADVVLIEAEGVGRALAQELRGTGRTAILGIRPRGDKVDRMAAQSAKIEAGQVLLPERAPWRAEFLDELLAFPSGRHDDQVDSMAQFLKWIARPRWRRPGERPNPVRPEGRQLPPPRLRSGRQNPYDPVTWLLPG